MGRNGRGLIRFEPTVHRIEQYIIWEAVAHVSL
jgi:hypothetical protein